MKIAGGAETTNASLWVRTALLGLFGGVLFGVIVQFWMEIMSDVGALYGDHSVVRGWAAHLFHSVVGAFVFTGIVGRSHLSNFVTSASRRAAFGLLYGVILWAIFNGIILPIWLDAMTQWGGGTPVVESKLRFPVSFIGFLMYGLIVSTSVPLPGTPVEEHDSEPGGAGDELGPT